MNWHYVDISEVYYIHKTVIKKAGTSAFLRDFALLQSAVGRPKASYGGKDLYPTVFLKAASLVQSICLNHAFSDGNKRTAWLSVKRFLYINGYLLNAKTKEAVKFVIDIDIKKTDTGKISQWLRAHSKRRNINQ